MALTIGGVNYDAYLKRETLAHVNALTSEPDTLSFELNPGAPKPRVGAEVVYTLPNGDRLFGGVLTACPEVKVNPLAVGYQCACTDWRARANRKTLNDRWVNMTAGEIIVAAFAKYAPEFDTSGVDLGGRVLASIRFKRGAYLTDMLDTLKGLTGYIWDIDPDKNVRWEAPGTTPAPMIIADGSRNFKDLVVEVNRDGLRNKIIVKGSFYPAATATTDTFDGDGLTTNFRLSRTPYGTDQYVVLSEDFSSLDLTRWTKTSPSNPSPPAGHIPSDGYLFTTIQNGAALAESGWLQVVGGNSTWGDVRLTSYLPYARVEGRRVEFDVVATTLGHGMVGLWDPNDLSVFAGGQHVFYFDPNAGQIVVYEGGTARTSLTPVTYTAGVQYRLRISLKSSGATYWVNADEANGFRASQWVKLYDSTFSSRANLTVVPIFNHSFNGRVDRVKVFNRLFDITLTVGGVEKVIGLLNQDEDAGVDALIGASAGEVPVLVFFGDSKPVAGTGNVILTYYPKIPVVVQAQDSISVAAIAALEGNDGIYEGYIEDDTLDRLDLARARATQELEQTANPTTSVSFVTRESGLRAGQVIPASLTPPESGRELSGSFLIQQVETRSLGSGQYESTVLAGSRLKGLDAYLLDLLRAGRQSDTPEDDNAIIDELVWATDTLTLTDAGSVAGVAVSTTDTITFTDLGTVTAGPVGPFRYGACLGTEDGGFDLVLEDGAKLSTESARYGLSAYAA